MRVESEQQLAAVTRLVHVPSWTSGGYHLEADLKSAAFKKKILQFSGELKETDPVQALTSAEFTALDDLVTLLEDKASYHSSALTPDVSSLVKKLMGWPSAKILPVLDGYRVLMCHSASCARLGDDLHMQQILLAHAKAGKHTHQALALRGLTNWLAKRVRPQHERRGEFAAPLVTFITQVLDQLKGAHTDETATASLCHAYTMFVYNLIVWFGRVHPGDSDWYTSVTSSLMRMLSRGLLGDQCLLKDKTVFYALLTLATVGHCNEVAKDVIKHAFTEQLAKIIKIAKEAGNPPVREVAEDCVRVFGVST
jgi:hypothetical protein